MERRSRPSALSVASARSPSPTKLQTKKKILPILISSPIRGPDLSGKSYLKSGITDLDALLPERVVAADPILSQQIKCCEINLGGLCRNLLDVQKGDNLQFRDSRTFFKRAAQKIMLDNEAKMTGKTAEWNSQLDKILPSIWNEQDVDDAVMVDWRDAHRSKQAALNTVFSAASAVLRERYKMRFQMVRSLHNAARKRNQTVMNHFKREDSAIDAILWLVEKFPAVAVSVRHKDPKFGEYIRTQVENNHPTMSKGACHSGYKRFMQIVGIEPRSGLNFNSSTLDELDDGDDTILPTKGSSTTPMTSGNKNYNWDDIDDLEVDDAEIFDPDVDLLLKIRQLQLDLKQDSLRFNGSITAMVMQQMKKDRELWGDYRYIELVVKQTLINDLKPSVAERAFENLEMDLTRSHFLMNETERVLRHLVKITGQTSKKVTGRAKSILVRHAGLDRTTEAQKNEADSKAGYGKYDLHIPKRKVGSLDRSGQAVKLPPSEFPSSMSPIVPIKLERADPRKRMAQLTKTEDEDSEAQSEIAGDLMFDTGTKRNSFSYKKGLSGRRRKGAESSVLPIAVQAALLRKSVAVPDAAVDEDLKSLLHDPVVMTALDHHSQFEGKGIDSWALEAAKKRTRETVTHLKKLRKAVSDPTQVASLRICLPSGTRLADSRLRIADECPESPRSRQKLFSTLNNALNVEIDKLEHILGIVRPAASTNLGNTGALGGTMKSTSSVNLKNTKFPSPSRNSPQPPSAFSPTVVLSPIIVKAPTTTSTSSSSPPAATSPGPKVSLTWQDMTMSSPGPSSRSRSPSPSPLALRNVGEFPNVPDELPTPERNNIVFEALLSGKSSMVELDMDADDDDRRKNKNNNNNEEMSMAEVAQTVSDMVSVESRTLQGQQFLNPHRLHAS